MQVIQKIKAKLNNSPRRVILDTRKKCSNNSTCRIIITALALGIACLSCNAYAEIGSSDVDFSLSVDATPSLEIVLAGDGLTTSPTSLGLNIKPNIDGTPVFGYSDLDVTVATSNATGYYLNFSTTNADGSLRTTSSSTLSTLADTGTFTCTTATASTCSFTTNRWGYKLAQDDATSYIAAPGSDGTKIDEIYTKTNGVTSNLRVGAKVDSSLTAGNYSTTMSFAATAHPTTYGIYYNAGAAGNSASGLPGTQSGALNNASTTTVTLSSDVPTWTGHTFNKWCLGTITSTEYANDTCTGTEYSPGDTITFSMDDVVSVTLKAMWNINSYSIEYGTTTGIASVTLDGQTCTEAVSGTGCSKTLIYGKPYNISATASTGYSFSSYSATAGTFGSTSTASTTYTPAAGAATITPNASANTYSITIKTATGISSVSLSGGNLTSACTATDTTGTSCTLTYGQTYTLAASVSTGYTFSSWSNSASQGTIAGTTTANTTYTPGTAATTLTPSATPRSYTCTKQYRLQNADGTWGNYITDTTEQVAYGSTCSYTKRVTNYTGVSGTNSQSASTSGTMGTSGLTLRLSFYRNTYTINVTNSNTTSGASSLTIRYGGSATVTVTPSSGYYLSDVSCPSGYACSGYNTGTSYTSQQTVTVTNNGTTSGGTLSFTGGVPCTISGTMQGVTSLDSYSVGDCGTLTDTRTSIAYNVKVLSLNGTKTLWMMSNLKLPGGTALTTSNSNVTSSYTLPSQTEWTSSSQNDFCIPRMAYVSSNDEYYYNWPAATARTNSTSSTDSSIGCTNDTGNSVGDICPKGWRLPEYTSTEVNNSTWRSDLQANGSITNTGVFVSGSQSQVGSNGNWWTSTWYSNSGARYLFYWKSTLYVSENYKMGGYSVRCMRTS